MLDDRARVWPVLLCLSGAALSIAHGGCRLLRREPVQAPAPIAESGPSPSPVSTPSATPAAPRAAEGVVPSTGSPFETSAIVVEIWPEDSVRGTVWHLRWVTQEADAGDDPIRSKRSTWVVDHGLTTNRDVAACAQPGDAVIDGSVEITVRGRSTDRGYVATSLENGRWLKGAGFRPTLHDALEVRSLPVAVGAAAETSDVIEIRDCCLSGPTPEDRDGITIWKVRLLGPFRDDGTDPVERPPKAPEVGESRRGDWWVLDGVIVNRDVAAHAHALSRRDWREERGDPWPLIRVTCDRSRGSGELVFRQFVPRLRGFDRIGRRHHLQGRR
jgi:hypothetical protein